MLYNIVAHKRAMRLENLAALVARELGGNRKWDRSREIFPKCFGTTTRSPKNRIEFLQKSLA